MAQDISKKETTAVEWLVEQFNLQAYIPHIQQAKAMEKEQIEEAYSNGSNDRLKNRINEQYYKETYGS